MPQFDWNQLPDKSGSSSGGFDWNNLPDKTPESPYESAWHWAMKPVTELPGQLFKLYSDTMYPKSKTPEYMRKYTEGAKNISASALNAPFSPAGLAQATAMGLSGGTTALAPALSRGAMLAARGIGGMFAGEGAYNMLNDPTLTGKAFGALEALGGIAGMKYSPAGPYTPNIPNWVGEEGRLVRGAGWLPDEWQGPRFSRIDSPSTARTAYQMRNQVEPFTLPLPSRNGGPKPTMAQAVAESEPYKFQMQEDPFSPLESRFGGAAPPAEAPFDYGSRSAYPRIERPELPFESGDPSLGFRRQTNPNESLGYPLDIVPDSLRPRAVQSGLGRQIPTNMWERMANDPAGQAPGNIPLDADSVFKGNWPGNNPPGTPPTRMDELSSFLDDVIAGRRATFPEKPVPEVPVTPRTPADRVQDMIRNIDESLKEPAPEVRPEIPSEVAPVPEVPVAPKVEAPLTKTQLQNQHMDNLSSFLDDIMAGRPATFPERPAVLRTPGDKIKDMLKLADDTLKTNTTEPLTQTEAALKMADQITAGKSKGAVKSAIEQFIKDTKGETAPVIPESAAPVVPEQVPEPVKISETPVQPSLFERFISEDEGALNPKKLRENITKLMGPGGARLMRGQLQGALARLDATGTDDIRYKTLLPPELANKGLGRNESYRSRVIDLMNAVASSRQAPGTNPIKDTVVGRLVQAHRDAYGQRAEQDVLYTQDRAKRFGELKDVKTIGAEGAWQKLAKLKGPLRKISYEPIRLSQKDTSDLFNLIHNAGMSGEDQAKAITGMAKLLGEHSGGKVVPQPSELEVLRRVLGTEEMNQIMELHASLGGLPYKLLLEGVNVPKAAMATVDLSAPLRQGSGMILTKEFWTNFKTLFQTYGSESAYDSVMASIKEHPLYDSARKAGLAIGDLKKITEREEPILSDWLEKIQVTPKFLGKTVGGIQPARASNRAYQAYLAKLRMDSYVRLIKDAERVGAGGGVMDTIKQATGIGRETGQFKASIESAIGESPAFRKAIAQYINDATGRGKIPGEHGEAAALFLNNFMFSPRLMASRINMLNPLTYANASPFIRKQYLRSLAGIATMGMTVTGLAKMFGGEVGDEGTSADFGKVKVGNVRLDPWGGFQQYIVLAKRLREGKYTSTITGRTSDLNSGRFNARTYKDTLESFLVSKGNPVATYMYGLMTGKGFDNMPFDEKRELWDRITPMVLGDMVELYKEDPEAVPFMAKLAMGSGALLGMGLQTYQPTNRITTGYAEPEEPWWSPFSARQFAGPGSAPRSAVP